ncbi:hypothetical protein SPHINGO391_380055 [Sphingomonas aurantiaca]|uniref:Uncharacterized protein n=1 Tax=Sphingomonas aurantiaca TaxID=185949 RepID=A0A5E7YM95_9SPHN|nr:hypothetical protein SPHINGO391_380055 [Sphingomonas aurantiaca]
MKRASRIRWRTFLAMDGIFLPAIERFTGWTFLKGSGLYRSRLFDCSKNSDVCNYKGRTLI